MEAIETLRPAQPPQPVQPAQPVQPVIDRLRRREAVLVAGSRCAELAGLPATAALAERLANRVEDADRRRGIEALLASGRHGPALAWARAALGSDAVVEGLREALPAGRPVPEALAAVAALPWRGILTTAYDDLWTRAVAAAAGDKPPPYTGCLPADGRAFADGRARFLLHVFGRIDAPESVCLGPGDLRERLAPSGAREALGELSDRLSFVFVGFAADDPDLEWLSAWVLGARAPRVPHFVLHAGVDALAAERVAAELGASAIVCSAEGGLEGALLDLARAAADASADTRPVADDVAGWLARWDESPADSEAAAALAAIAARLDSEGRYEELAEVELARVERLTDPGEHVAVLRSLARVLDQHLDSPERAYATLITALKADARAPETRDVWKDLARIVQETKTWSAFAADLAELASWAREAARPDDEARLRVERAIVADERLGDTQAAISELERALELEPSAEPAVRRLRGLYDRTGRDMDGLRLTERLAEAAADPDERIALLHDIAARWESRPGGARPAAEALERARTLGDERDGTLSALARLHERCESWRALAHVLDRRAELAGDARDRVDALVQCGRVHAERLGDWAAAAERYARANEINPKDARALEALAGARRTLGDRAAAAELLEAAAEQNASALDKARLTCEAAALHDEHLGDEARALRLYQRAFSLDPQLVTAGLRLAALLEARHRTAELDPVLSALVRQAGEEPGASELWRRLGACARERGDSQKALAAYERARRLDATSAPALLGLAELRLERREWAEARDLWREIRDREAAAAGDGDSRAQRLAICLGLAEAEAALGETETAVGHYRDAVAIDPGHAGAWKGLAALERERGAHEAALAANQKLVRLAPPSARAEIWDEIGDLHRLLGQYDEAGSAYVDALAVEPQRRRTLHKQLDLQAEREQWRAALATLAQLADLEPAPEVRAKYLYSAAAIHREKLAEPERAVALFERALDACWSFHKAFDAIERLLTDAQDYRGLRRAYRSMLKRIPTGSDPALEAGLWERLGELSLQRFDDRDTGVLAFEAAAHIDESDPSRLERLADLYVELGPTAVDKGIAAHQRILARKPDRVASYEALMGLYGEARAPEKQWWAAAALAFFGEQSPSVRALVERQRPPQVVAPDVQLTQDLWPLLESPNEDRRWGDLLALVAPHAATATAPKRSTLGLKRADRIPLGGEAAPARGRRRAQTEGVDWFPAHALAYVSRVLGVGAPDLFYRPEHFCAVSTHVLEEDGAATAAIVIGQAFEQRLDDDAMIFELGRQIARLRPRAIARVAWRTPEAFSVAARAILAVAGVSDEAAGADRVDVEALTRLLRRSLPAAVIEAAAAFVKEAALGPAQVVELDAWADAADAAAARAAFLLTGNLAAAERALWIDPALAEDARHERLRELVAFSVSDAHFTLRAALGLDAAPFEGVRQWAHG